MPTATALTVVTDALRKLGVLASGEVPDGAQGQDALAELNRLLEVWSLQRRLVYRIVDTVIPLTAARASYTLGPGGDVNVARPLQVGNGFTRRQDLDFPFTVVTKAQYDTIGIKTLSAPWPWVAYYDPAVPLATLTFWPVPSEANEVHLPVDTQFSALTGLSQALSFPPGYQDGLTLSLALRLSGEYGVTPSPTLVAQHRETMAVLKQANATPVVADVDPRLPAGRQKDGGWIFHGGYR